MVKIITRYDQEARAEVAPGVSFHPKRDKSLTNQADLEASDINNIMARYEKTGLLVDDLGNFRQPMSGDFSEVKTYHEMLSAVRDAERWFLAFPAKVRNRFKNDVQELVNFLEDSKNDEEAVSLGLKSEEVLLTAEYTDPKTGAKRKVRPAEKKNLEDRDAERAAKGAPPAAAGAGGQA